MGLFASLGLWESVSNRDLPKWVNRAFDKRFYRREPVYGELAYFYGRRMVYRVICFYAGQKILDLKWSRRKRRHPKV